MKSYKHFTLSEREYLQESLEKGKSIRQIAKFLGRSPSSVSREIKRNWSKKSRHYHAWHAQTNYLHRRKSRHRKNTLLLNKQMYRFAFQGILQYWSPELISGKWNSSHEPKMSFSSVYRTVRACLFPNVKSWTHLRRKNRPYASQRKTFTRYSESSIHSRDPIIELRGRIGDFEGDTVYGSVGKGYLITGVDRRSRYLIAAIARDKKAQTTNAAFVEAFKNAERKIKPLTLTLDNGTEFAEYRALEKELGITIYFADTHSPWQRGSNENINGLIRFFFPRGTNFNEVSDEQLRAVVELINNWPRKCLNFLSPNEYLDSLLHLV